MNTYHLWRKALAAVAVVAMAAVAFVFPPCGGAAGNDDLTLMCVKLANNSK